MGKYCESEVLHSVDPLDQQNRSFSNILNEHVLAGHINLFQKFKVENNFDLDEMDVSIKMKRGSFTLES